MNERNNNQNLPKANLSLIGAQGSGRIRRVYKGGSASSARQEPRGD